MMSMFTEANIRLFLTIIVVIVLIVIIVRFQDQGNSEDNSTKEVEKTRRKNDDK